MESNTNLFRFNTAKVCSSFVNETLGMKGILLGGSGIIAETFLVNTSGQPCLRVMALIESKGFGFHCSILISLCSFISLK